MRVNRRAFCLYTGGQSLCLINSIPAGVAPVMIIANKKSAFLAGILVVPWIFHGGTAVVAFQSKMVIKGYTQPKVTIHVAFAQPGKIVSLLVDEGAEVERGTCLAVLESSGLVASLKIAKARASDDSPLMAARGEIDALEQRLDDLSELVESGGASNQEVRRVATELEVARAKLQGAKADQEVRQLEVERIEEEVNQRRLTSPIAGFVTQIFRRAGEYVPATEPEVLEVVQLHPLKIRFFVPSNAASALTPSSAIELWLPQKMKAPAGSITSVSPVIDPVSDTVEVWVEIPNAEQEFQAGLMCELLLPSIDPTSVQMGKRQETKNE